MCKSASLHSVDSVRKLPGSVSSKHRAYSRRALLLQGPVGPFFTRFSTDLNARGFHVTKVNFNGGDGFFYRQKPRINYTGEFDEWEAWIERLLINRKISRVYLFGDCRAYHRVARSVANRLGIKVFVFEEGYLRPNYITLEESGVNGYSSMMHRDFSLVKPACKSSEKTKETKLPGFVFLLTAIYSMIYYMAMAASRDQFKHYRHHRSIDCWAEGVRWFRSGLRKIRYARQERQILQDVMMQYEGNYFVCPLQVHCDMQVIVHSDYNSIEHFIGDVLTSFQKYAGSNKSIVFKHHPLDRGYKDYRLLFDRLVAELGLEGRVFYLHDVCLPTLLKHAQGTILINSTVGMSSLFHGTPVKTLGKAIYDVPGLTSQVSLKEFWGCESKVDKQLFMAFRTFLINRNQLNGNFYRRVNDSETTGLVWSDPLAAEHSWVEGCADSSVKPELKVVAGTAVPGFNTDDQNNAKAA